MKKNIKKLNSENISESLRHFRKIVLEGKNPTNNLQLVDINLIVLRLKSLRKHSKKQIQKLINAIIKVGYVNPILLDKKYNIIAGELRLLAAKELGFTQIPAIILENLTQFIGILSLFDYTSNINEEYYPKLKKYFKYNFLKDIYIELEKIKPIFKNIENISSQEIQELLESQLSKDLINQVAYSEMITLKQNYAHRGLYNLFYLLLEIDLSNFGNWIIKTTRTDFKIIFLNTIFCCHTNSNIVLNSLDKSNIGIIQAFYALRRFQIDKMCRNIDCDNENIDLLFETNLSKRNKFIIYLQYITKKYHGLNLKQLEEHNEFEKDINKFNGFDYNYTEEEFFDFINIYYSIIGFKIIQKIQDASNKQLFLEKLQDILLVYLSSERLIDNNIDYANLIGFISLELNNCNNLEKYFNKKYKKLSFPYSFCKVKNWDDQVVFMFYLLISIYVYKKTKNEEFAEYIEKLNFIIGDIKCYTLKNFNKYLDQMK